jgi:Fuc2NAc and GlcNAc transferase
VTVTLAVATAFLTSLLFCGFYLRLAHRWQMLDMPNHRSAHVAPTPRGGGIGIFLGLFFAMGILQLAGESWSQPWTFWSLLAALLVLAGVVDDRFGLPVVLRLAVYALAGAAALWVLLPAASTPWIWILSLLYILWITNLFNFMDGIDGIAAAEACFVFAAAAGLALWQGTQGAYPLFCLLLAAACLAFLHWNWSPARLFMGDAGSIPLGFLLALLSVQGELRGALSLVAWLVLLAAFIADATFTLVWRALHREKITQAHSRHLYQRLARHWTSHGKVVLAMLGYNLLWLLPLAAASVALPGLWWLWLALAYLPLLPILLKAGKLP